MLAIVLLDQDQPERAIAELRAALRLAPDSALAHYHLATALRRAGQRAEADGHLQRARALDPRLEASSDPAGHAPEPGASPGSATGASR
jgi:Flp pilus assembly protein TadD